MSDWETGLAWASMIDRLRGAPRRCSRGLPGLTFMAVGVFLFIACPKSVSSFPPPPFVPLDLFAFSFSVFGFQFLAFAAFFLGCVGVSGGSTHWENICGKHAKCTRLLWIFYIF